MTTVISGMYLGNYVFQILLAFVREYQVVSLSFLIRENHPSLADRDYEVVLSKLRFFAIFYFCILSFSCLTGTRDCTCTQCC